MRSARLRGFVRLKSPYSSRLGRFPFGRGVVRVRPRFQTASPRDRGDTGGEAALKSIASLGSIGGAEFVRLATANASARPTWRGTSTGW